MFKQRIASAGEGLAIIYVFMLYRKRRVMNYDEVIKRNQEIIRLRNSGKTWKAIGDIFNLSGERCRQIYDYEKRKSKSIEINQKEKTFLAALYEIASESLVTRTFRCLDRAGIINQLDDNIYALDTYSDEILMSLRGFGLKCLNTARAANDLYKSWHR